MTKYIIYIFIMLMCVGTVFSAIEKRSNEGLLFEGVSEQNEPFVCGDMSKDYYCSVSDSFSEESFLKSLDDTSSVQACSNWCDGLDDSFNCCSYIEGEENGEYIKLCGAYQDASLEDINDDGAFSLNGVTVCSKEMNKQKVCSEITNKNDCSMQSYCQPKSGLVLLWNIFPWWGFKECVDKDMTPPVDETNDGGDVSDPDSGSDTPVVSTKVAKINTINEISLANSDILKDYNLNYDAVYRVAYDIGEYNDCYLSGDNNAFFYYTSTTSASHVPLLVSESSVDILITSDQAQKTDNLYLNCDGSEKLDSKSLSNVDGGDSIVTPATKTAEMSIDEINQGDSTAFRDFTGDGGDKFYRIRYNIEGYNDCYLKSPTNIDIRDGEGRVRTVYNLDISKNILDIVFHENVILNHPTNDVTLELYCDGNKKDSENFVIKGDDTLVSDTLYFNPSSISFVESEHITVTHSFSTDNTIMTINFEFDDGEGSHGISSKNYPANNLMWASNEAQNLINGVNFGTYGVADTLAIVEYEIINGNGDVVYSSAGNQDSIYSAYSHGLSVSYWSQGEELGRTLSADAYPVIKNTLTGESIMVKQDEGVYGVYIGDSLLSTFDIGTRKTFFIGENRLREDAGLDLNVYLEDAQMLDNEKVLVFSQKISDILAQIDKNKQNENIDEIIKIQSESQHVITRIDGEENTESSTTTGTYVEPREVTPVVDKSEPLCTLHYGTSYSPGRINFRLSYITDASSCIKKCDSFEYSNGNEMDNKISCVWDGEIVKRYQDEREMIYGESNECIFYYGEDGKDSRHLEHMDKLGCIEMCDEVAQGEYKDNGVSCEWDGQIVKNY